MEERLRKFAVLVEAGNYTRAAEQLHLSQPALSTAISKLERELHGPLLVRGPRSFQLTAAGKLAYDAAKELRITTGNLRVRLAALAHEQPAVSIGMIDSVGTALFDAADNIGELEQQAKVSLVVDNSRHLLRAVERDELDIAFVAERPGQTSPLLQATFVASEPLLAVCHAAHAPAVRHAVREGRLPQFISYDQASTTHQLIAAAMQEHGIEPRVTFFSTSPEVMLRLVLLQKGTAVLPYLLVRDLMAAGTLTPIGLPQQLIIERRIAAINRHGKELPIPLTNLVIRVRELLLQHFTEATHI